MSFYTRLLHGQEEIKQVIQDIRKEISQVANYVIIGLYNFDYNLCNSKGAC